MKQLLSVLALFLATSAFAGEEAQPKAVAQSFYDGYMKILLSNGDSIKYVTGSKLVTSQFKAVFKKTMDRPEADPIICGQDYPDGGFNAATQAIDGDTATVQMKSRDAAFDHKFNVQLRKVKGAWQICGTDDLSE